MITIVCENNTRCDEKSVLSEVVDIHCKALADDLLPKLGRKYLLHTFYPTILQESTSLLIIEEKDKAIRGFILIAKPITSYPPLSKGKRLLRLLSAALTRPNTWLKLIGAACSREHLTLARTSSTFEIVVLAVHPEFQREGIGKKLVESALYKINNQALLTKTSSDAALKFYFNMGFTKIGYESRGGRHFSILEHTTKN